MTSFKTLVFSIKLKKAKESGDTKEYKRLCELITFLCLDYDEQKRYLKRKNKK